MDFDAYLFEARKTAIYPRNKAVEYLALGICSEAGEVASKIKKFIRDGPAPGRDALADEIGDVLWYLAMFADELNYSLDEIAERNLRKLARRKEAGMLGGSGDNR